MLKIESIWSKQLRLVSTLFQIAEFGLCGNGVVDQGEDCDCGSQEECVTVDPCCDPVTCRLKREAECSTGHCCDNCKVLTYSKAGLIETFGSV